MELFLLNIYKVPKKFATRSFWTLPVWQPQLWIYFVLYREFFKSTIMNMYGYVQNTGPKPKILWLFSKRYYQWKVNCIALPQFTLIHKIPQFPLISCCGNFMERRSLRRVSGASSETLRELRYSQKFPY